MLLSNICYHSVVIAYQGQPHLRPFPFLEILSDYNYNYNFPTLHMRPVYIILPYRFFSVAKRKSIFDDRPMEIEELTHIIKHDMGSLNKQILQLQQLSRQRGAETAGKNVQNFSSNVVVTLQQKLANMSSQFKQVLDVRTEVRHRRRGDNSGLEFFFF